MSEFRWGFAAAADPAVGMPAAICEDADVAAVLGLAVGTYSAGLPPTVQHWQIRLSTRACLMDRRETRCIMTQPALLYNSTP